MTSLPSKRSTVFMAAALAAGAAGCAGGGNAGSLSCVDEPGVICTWAGTGEAGFDGDGHALTESNFYWPIDITIDKKLGTYVLDWNNHRVRLLKKDGTLKTVIGTDFVGDGPEDLSDQTLPGAPGTSVNLNHPTQLVPMLDGTLALVSWHNHKLRSYDPKTGLVTVTCGGMPGFGGDGGPARKAQLNQPSQLAIDDDGTQYIVDQRNQVIRRIQPDGTIGTMAGTPTMAGNEGDGGPADKAKLNFPAGPNPLPAGGLALDGNGNLFVSDTLNHTIRKIDLASNEITTIAGTGEPGFSGDRGPATDAKLNFPRKLAIGPDGRLYVADQMNDRIRAIDLKKGTITTVAGTGKRGFSGDGGPPEDAKLDRPASITFGTEGALYIVDTYNSRIRRVLPEVAK